MKYWIEFAMIEFIQNQIFFYLSLVLILFLPGYFLLLAVFKKRTIIDPLERFILSFGLSIIVIDFIAFGLSGLKIPITRLSSLLGIIGFDLICYLVYRFKKENGPTEKNDSKLFVFSKNQTILILLLLFLTVFIRVAYLSGTVLPTSTDMGHHMYWSKWMFENHQLPTYDGMPDFIIGEHVIFGLIAILSGASFFSAFPPVVLFLVNMLGILSVFILTLRIFKSKTVAILTLLFLGAIFAVSSPQIKYVSGGVVGNIMGNFLMPLALYFCYRAFEFMDLVPNSPLKKEDCADSRKFLALAIFAAFGLFYTHHLTTFIFLFVMTFFVSIFLIMNFKRWKTVLQNIGKIVLSPEVLAAFILGILFFFFIFTPTYVNPSAVDTAVGTPSKATRAGLSLASIRSSVGEARFGLGFLGILFLFLSKRFRNFGSLLLISWAVMIFVMATQPGWLFIDIPSDRIVTYFSYPLAILSAFCFFYVFNREKEAGQISNLVKSGFFIALGFVLIGGISDSANALANKNSPSKMIQTFHSSEYLAQNTTSENVILKDHNYITADSWIKLFFMRGYKYPDSRGYFKRYEDPTKPREMCTLYMISNPSGKEARNCFEETKTDFIMVNPTFDKAQFDKLKNFNLIYNNPGVVIYYRKQNEAN